jgi:hypothetical protein
MGMGNHRAGAVDLEGRWATSTEDDRSMRRRLVERTTLKGKKRMRVS